MSQQDVQVTRRSFIKSTGSFFGCVAGLSVFNGCGEAGSGHAGTELEKRPNVLMIVSDDQGCGDLCKYAENPHINTPNLDKLYKESTRLTNYIVSPLCAPTRASLMTGRYNYRTGVWDTWMGRCGMHDEEVTVAQCLRDNGYSTGIFGKWHLGDNCPMRPRDNGFDEVSLWVDSMGARFDPMIETNGVRKREKGFLTDILFDKAMAFIGRNKSRPFFAYVPSFLPHDNTKPQVPGRYIEPYKNLDHLTQGDKEVYAMVTKLDENIGRLLAEVKNLGLEKDTLVIYFSDNGPLKLCPDLVSQPEILACRKHDMGDRYNCGLRGGKTNVYDGGIKTPCFVKMPGVVPAGRDVETMVAHIDMKPTILGFCGVQDSSGPAMDGMDLSRLLKGQKQDVPDRAIIIQSDRVEAPQPWRNACVRQQRWKLVNGDELYDLKNDPGEQYNVAAKHPQKVRKLRAIYDKWFMDIISKAPFRPGITYIGSPRQQEVFLNIYHRHSTGWPIKVIRSGKYKVTVTGIQKQLFAENSEMRLTFGDQHYRRNILTGAENLVYENIMLEKGVTNFDIMPEGYKKPEKMYYGNEDFGYREIVIEPQF